MMGACCEAARLFARLESRLRRWCGIYRCPKNMDAFARRRIENPGLHRVQLLGRFSQLIGACAWPQTVAVHFRRTKLCQRAGWDYEEPASYSPEPKKFATKHVARF